MAATADTARIRRMRATAQLLAGPPARSVAAVPRQVLALQAQDLRAVRLAVRARSTNITAAGVNDAIGRREVVIGWLGRGTLHMVEPDDYPWLLGLTGPPQRQANSRRLLQEGFPPDRARRAVGLIERALADGPMERSAIGQMLARRDLDPGGQALVHLLFQSGLGGTTVRGPVVRGRQTFVLARDWLGTVPLGELRGADRERALAELARRYLRGHGPATAADLALWAALPLRDARSAFAAISGELREIGPMAMLRLGKRRTAEPPPRLLGAFDAYTLGWKDREFAVPGAHATEVRRDGWIKSVVTVSGVAVGVWSSRTSGRRLTVEQQLWTQPSAADAKLLREDAAALARFEGLELAVAS